MLIMCKYACPHGHKTDEEWITRQDDNGKDTIHSCTVQLPLPNTDVYSGKTHLNFKVLTCWECLLPYFDYQCTQIKENENVKSS